MGKVILIVEDDPKNLKLIRDVLRVNSYATLEAFNGKQGVEMAKNEMPDLILMDIQTPILDGLEATRILKTDVKTSKIPIVALTAKALKGDRQKCIQAGADDYLSKPVDYDGLIRLAKAWIEKE